MRIASLFLYSLFISAIFALPTEAFAANGKGMDPEKLPQQTQKQEAVKAVSSEEKVKAPLEKAKGNASVQAGKPAPAKPQTPVPQKSVQKALPKENAKPNPEQKARGKVLNQSAKQNVQEKQRMKRDVQSIQNGKGNVRAQQVKEQLRGKKSGTAEEKLEVLHHAEKMQSSLSERKKAFVKNRPSKASSENADAKNDVRNRTGEQPVPKPKQVYQPVHGIAGFAPETTQGQGGACPAGQSSGSQAFKAGMVYIDGIQQPDHSQFFVSRFKMFRNQWVNAPPVEPPRNAS